MPMPRGEAVVPLGLLVIVLGLLVVVADRIARRSRRPRLAALRIR
jgi:hypothetical protein